MQTDYTVEPSVVEGQPTFQQIDNLIGAPLETLPNKKFMIAISITLTMLGIGAVSLALSLYYGIGMWGNNNPVGWGFDIVNFVFWVGIGHAGTLISAILFLFRQKWRTGIARFAEGMTIFAVMTAGLFPALPHWKTLDRPLFDSASKRPRFMGEFHFAAFMGRFCGFHLFYRIRNYSGMSA